MHEDAVMLNDHNNYKTYKNYTQNKNHVKIKVIIILECHLLFFEA